MESIRKIRLFMALALLLLSLSAHSLTIKMGCMAPSGSPWGRALHELAASWHRITDGQVSLKLYLGGIAGDESDMIRKIRIGQLQGAAVTSIGLNDITPDVLTLNIPFLIRNDREFSYVLDKAGPSLESSIEEKGFKVLAWSFTGWVQLFSRNPVVYPRDLRGQKLGIPSKDAAVINGWRAMGFDAFTLSMADLMVGLQSGMVDAYYSPPLVAAAFQWFSVGNHMSLLKILPVYGGIIIDARAWDRIPEKYKPALEETVLEAERSFSTETNSLEEKAFEVMKRHGLKVHPVPEDAEKEWRELMESASQSVIGSTISREFYEEVKGYLSDFRAGKSR